MLHRFRLTQRIWGTALVAVLACSCAWTQEQASPQSLLPHWRDGRFWVSGQANFIYQTHPDFSARYSGSNSLSPRYEKAISRVLTLQAGLRLDRRTEVLAHVEETGGRGLSTSLGMAGASNLDALRNPSLGSTPYLARLIVHRVVALSARETEVERGPMSTFSQLPERRLDLRAGRFSTVDFFDQNAVGSDSHFQFMNWATAQNGAYDYAADTHGYTWGAVVEYQQKDLALRAAETLMPQVANGTDEVWNLRRAHAENFEIEWRHGLLPKKEGTIRLLSFVNHANMGVYADAVADGERRNVTPDITAHAWRMTSKYGFGANLEQSLAANFTAYARWGWNDGQTESFVYTEIDSTIAGGLGANGRAWHRVQDRAGLAWASNGISRAHQNYLAHGGLGFILGDGALNYGRENIVEFYYTAHLWRGIYLGPDVQRIDHPGYNRDRGPVVIPGFRLHTEL